MVSSGVCNIYDGGRMLHTCAGVANHLENRRRDILRHNLYIGAVTNVDSRCNWNRDCNGNRFIVSGCD